MNIALWAINGIGVGHTVRVCILARSFLQKGHNVKVLLEHQQQRHAIGRLQKEVQIEFAERPWKVNGKSALTNETKIKSFLSDYWVIADMASIPSAESFLPLIGHNTDPIFLLRWMSSAFLKERILPRWSNYDSAHAIVVLPEAVFNILLGRQSYSLPRFWFAPGFVFCSQPNRIGPPDAHRTRRVAFACGGGGIHSDHGFDELSRIVEGFALTRSRLNIDCEFHAWVGASAELLQVSRASNCFDLIRTLQDSATPDWNDYDVIVARPSFNSLLEIMQADARVITGAFESDKEWTRESLMWLEQFGVQILNNIDASEISCRLLSSITVPRQIDLNIQRLRRTVFKNATEEVVSHCISLFD